MKNITVLFTEDNQEQVLLMSKALHRNNAVNQAISFQNGQEVVDFLTLLSRHRPTGQQYVLLLDVQMLQVNGIEVLNKIRNHRVLKSLPVVVFSSAKDEEVMNFYYHLGCNAFIPKPMDHGEYESLSMLDFVSVMQDAENNSQSFLKQAC